jgi:hypothetical protein
VIRAAPEHVYSFLARPEHLPRYAAPLWMAADAPEKRGAAQVVALRGYFAGLPVESVQRVALDPGASVDLTQVRGTLRAFAARCTLQGVEAGTEVVYRVEADPGIPMIPDDAARQFLVQYAERMLDRIKLAAERKSPARRPHPQGQPARPGARASAGAPEEDAAEPLEGPGEDGEAAPETEPAPPEVLAVEAQPEGALAGAAEAAARPTGAPAGGPGGTPGPGPGASPSGRRRRRRRRRRRGGAGGPPPPPRSPAG